MKITGIYFGIDCDPFQQRPDVYAKAVFDKLGVAEIEPYSKMFGAWQWNVKKNMTEEEWKEVNTWMKSEMDRLYGNDKIRGAQWDKLTASNDEAENEL